MSRSGVGCPGKRYGALCGVRGCHGDRYGALRGVRGCHGDRYVRYLKQMFCSSSCQYQTGSIDCYPSFGVYFN